MTAVLSWGALAFGAVYPWAFTPLALLMIVTGIGSLAFARRARRPPVLALAAAFLAIGLGTVVQLVPLNPATLTRVSPGTAHFRQQYERFYGRLGDARAEGAAAVPAKPISIAPEKTRVGLGLLTALAIFSIGCARLFSTTGARPITLIVLWLGVALAAIGIVQGIIHGDRVDRLVYGFWQTQQRGTNPFGPFINRNHFAGWMLMALPLALALFADSAQRLAAEAPSFDRRDFLAVVSSPPGGRVAMLGLACVVMGLALALTRSRSGLAAFALGGMTLVWILRRRLASVAGRSAVVTAVAAILLMSIAGAGLETSIGRFVRPTTLRGAQAGLDTAGGRLAAWRDTLQIIRSSPWTGQGLNSYGTAMIVFQSESRQLHFVEAHNDYLQLAAEGGLLLGVPILAAMLIFVRDVRRRFREAPHVGTTYWLRVGAVTGLVCIALQSLVEFSLQMPGNAALFATLVGIAIHQSPNLRSR